MTDNQSGPDLPGPVSPADERFARIEGVVRWVFWIGLAVVIAWVFIDLLIKH